MPRLPVVSGSRVPLLSIGDDTVVLAARPPLDPLLDVGAAVVEALRYPLSGPPLVDLVTPGGRATIVVEAPVLPFPSVPLDPRQEAVAAVIAELTRLGIPPDQQTILVAGGLQRRAGRLQLEAILRPIPARDFRGTVVVHDVEGDDLVSLVVSGTAPVSINRALLEADLIVTVTVAETSERGGAAALLAASAAESIAAPGPAPSLLAPSLSPTGALAGRLEAAVAARTTLMGVSLVLDHPRLTSGYRGYPWSSDTLDALRRSPLRRLHNALPGEMRSTVLDRLRRHVSTVAVLAGPPAVAHAEGLLRGAALRGVSLHGQLDTIIVPVPWKSLQAPRERINPITAAALALGHVLRLWRDASPLREDGTVVLLHDLHRTFGHGQQAPYRNLFQLLRDGATPAEVVAARATAVADPRAITAYRKGNAPHPALAFVDWASCGPVLARAESIIVGGCRDAGAARALGLVPAHSVATAIEMANGLAGGSNRTGVMLGPPYVPIAVT